MKNFISYFNVFTTVKVANNWISEEEILMGNYTDEKI